jgi:hypothetical protein
MNQDKKKIEKLFNKLDKLATKGKDQIYEYYKLVDDIVEKGDYLYFEKCLLQYYEIDISKFTSVSDVKKNTWSDILFLTNSSFSKKLKKLYDSKNVYQMVFDIHSESANVIGLTASSPLSITYSTTSSSQTITPSKSGNYIYLSTNDDSVYKLDIFRSEWDIVDGTYQPIPRSLTPLQTIEVFATQSLYQTEIPLSHGREYLVKSYSRKPLSDSFIRLNYRLELTKNSLIGKIVEIDTFSQKGEYYLENKEFAKVMRNTSTYLEVIKTGFTQSYIITSNDTSLSEEQNLINRYKIAIEYLLS